MFSTVLIWWGRRGSRGRKRLFCLCRLLATKLGAMGAPVTFDHPRQAVDDNVEKTADEQSGQAAEEGEQRRVDLASEDSRH